MSSRGTKRGTVDAMDTEIWRHFSCYLPMLHAPYYVEVCLKFRDLGANFGCLAGFLGMGGSKFSRIWALKWPFFCDIPPTWVSGVLVSTKLSKPMIELEPWHYSSIQTIASALHPQPIPLISLSLCSKIYLFIVRGSCCFVDPRSQVLFWPAGWCSLSALSPSCINFRHCISLSSIRAFIITLFFWSSGVN